MGTEARPDGRPPFEDLIERHSAELLRYLWRLLRDPDDAQDCLQETYLKAFRAYARLQSAANLRAWLYKIATNVARTHGRRRARLAGRTADLDGVLELRAESDGSDSAEENDLVLVVRAVNKLPHRQREALMMRKYQGLEYEEIALALGCTPTTARAHVYQAVRKLRLRFGEPAHRPPAQEAVA
ncbi:MAG: RNA polymerase sigma factor [Actinobacteria bacterium]|nr:RNA polymerase sigma factor [Actinomycetota bacterium]